jgi:hypothetical protein
MRRILILESLLRFRTLLNEPRPMLADGVAEALEILTSATLAFPKL